MGLPQQPDRSSASRATRAIAAKAECARSTVAEALKALEWAGVLTWQNRITRIRGARARPVRPLGEPLAGDPHLQCLRVPGPANCSFSAVFHISPKIRREHRTKKFLIYL